jgi:hypothetical protein
MSTPSVSQDLTQKTIPFDNGHQAQYGSTGRHRFRQDSEYTGYPTAPVADYCRRGRG